MPVREPCEKEEHRVETAQRHGGSGELQRWLHVGPGCRQDSMGYFTCEVRRLLLSQAVWTPVEDIENFKNSE